MEKSHISIGFLDISPVGKLWARQASNLQPTDYESGALTRLSYGPVTVEKSPA